MKDKREVSQRLEAVKARPLLYLGKVEWERAWIFLHGFYCGYFALSTDTENYADARNKILISRGWQVPAVFTEKEMEAKGMTNEEIVNEQLEIEIETWRSIEESNKE